MRIAVVHNLPLGGALRALSNQVKILSQRHHLDLFTLTSASELVYPLRQFVGKHVKIFYKQPGGFPKSIISLYTALPQAYKLLAEKINQGNYDLAYVNPCYLTQSPFVLRFLRIPSVYFCQEPKREFYEKIPRVSNFARYTLTYPFRLPLKRIDKINTQSATLVLVNSQFSKQKIDRIYSVSSKVNYLGVDTKIFHPLTSKKENLALTVGEFSLLKGHDFVIRSLGLIPKKIRPKLCIVGPAGVEKEYLCRLARRLKVELELAESIPDSKLVAYYSKAKVFLYAPIKEPFGMVLLEAASCGLPIVAVRDGGVPEVLSDENLGILVEREENKFAEAILTLLKKKETNKEKTKRHTYVKNNWSWEKSVAELDGHLRALIRLRGFPRP